MNKLPFQQVAVLMGGPSEEREVSLRSGRAIADGLRRAGYAVREVDVINHAFSLPPGCDAAFVALHGEFGEDGQVQDLLTRRGIPFPGARARASRQAFDKVCAKHILMKNGISTPAFEVVRRGQPRVLPLPVFVKPVRQGSSFGCHKVAAEADWPAALADALSYNGEAVVERFIDGRELTVGFVDDEALPVIEIRAPGNTYDYRAKYTQGLTEYRVPAPLTAEDAARCQALARAAYRALEGRGLGRVDLRMDAAGGLFVLELNTIPGFTETSLLPKAAQAAGYSFPALCDRILRAAVAL